MLSESGKLNAVLIQDSVSQFWTRRLPFEGIESSIQYLPRCPHPMMEGGHREWLQLPKYLKEEGVQVFEVTEVLKDILDGATPEVRKEIIQEVWWGLDKSPDPEDLSVEHLLWGYPEKPYYDKVLDRVVLPDFRRMSWPYPRDTSFTTQLGTVICNMRRYSRRFEPRLVKLCYKYDPILRDKIDLVHDGDESVAVSTEPPCIEGGDVQIIDEGTIAVGVGQRSTKTGFLRMAKSLLKKDREKQIEYIVAVKLAGPPATDYMHLDVTINWPARGKALVMPYFYKSQMIGDAPPRKLLLKTLEAVRRRSEKHGRPMGPLVHPEAFKDAGRCAIYVNHKGEPKLDGVEESFLDFLVKEGKLEEDEIIWVGGNPEEEFDLEHLYASLMEQARGAPNILTIKPGLVIAYERNKITNRTLREHGVRVKEWSDAYLDMLGGPHCSTSPLSRDSA
ncbi:MAG: arginine deiminase family protein [Candidatus Bathyarchaeia archaeon]